MPPAEAIKVRISACTLLNGQAVEYRLVHSKAAKSLRVRATVSGLVVVLPANRKTDEVAPFLSANEDWVLDQLTRLKRYARIRNKQKKLVGQILFRGKPTSVRVERAPQFRGAHKIVRQADGFVLIQSGGSNTRLVQSFENWLRREAKQEILKHVALISSRIKRHPKRVLVMGQRTKWGNCSALHNLSFNWRLIMAPEYVLRYLVTHEVVHLAVPDHSRRFWLTVHSLCPEMEKAKQWLCAHGHTLLMDLQEVCSSK